MSLTQQSFIQDFFFVRWGEDFIMLGTLGACPIEIMPLEIIIIAAIHINGNCN